jgi:fused signal recognition particle receptor
MSGEPQPPPEKRGGWLRRLIGRDDPGPDAAPPPVPEAEAAAPPPEAPPEPPAPPPAAAEAATPAGIPTGMSAEAVAAIRERLAREQAAEAEAKAGWLTRLRRGLSRSSTKLSAGIGELFTKRPLDQEALDELEELLIAADLGVDTAAKLTAAIGKARFGDAVAPDEIRTQLADEIARMLEPVARTITLSDVHKPHTILVCGVNGSGKTTTIAKLAHLFRSVGFKVVLAAGDTFRAAAIEQLQIWGGRAGCRVIARPPGSDAAGLCFEAFEQARAEKADVLLIDTAGRLQNRTDLMDELKKIIRVLKKLDETAPHDCLLVLDASVGQNAHNQVQVFRDIVEVTGLAVTKLDGSAKGGVVVALAERFGLPVYAVGVGEGIDDMRAFEAKAFARSLLGLDD